MKLRLPHLTLYLISIANEVTSFLPSPNLNHLNPKINTATINTINNALFLSPKPTESKDKIPKTEKSLQTTLFTSLLATMLFTIMPTPPTIDVTSVQQQQQLAVGLGENRVVVKKQVNVNNNFVVNAKEMASGTGSRVNKDPESLLRYGLPINNKEVRKLQRVIESIRQDIASKRKSAAVDGVKQTRTMLKSSSSKLLPSCRSSSVCTDILSKMDTQLAPLDAALKESLDTMQGSDQERKALDDAYKAHDKVLTSLTELEEQMVPAGYKTKVPEEYNDALPQLQGRATVVMEFKKPDGAPFNVNGLLFPQAKMKMVIDGYAAPLTSGNFIDLIQKGFYDKMPIQRSDGFVIQTGDPKGEAWGYVAKGTKSIGNGPHGERLIPNEIFVVGEKEPIYESTLEDEGKGGQATILPFSSYGAMGWARDEYDPNTGSSQFFWLLFDSDLTPAGKNVLDGRYPCFGYVVEGEDFLRDLKEDDVIISATVTSGIENLVQPK